MVHVGETGTKRQQTRFRCLRFASSRSAALGEWEHSKVKFFAAPRPLPTTPTWPAIETLHVEKKTPVDSCDMETQQRDAALETRLMRHMDLCKRFRKTSWSSYDFYRQDWFGYGSLPKQFETKSLPEILAHNRSTTGKKKGSQQPWIPRIPRQPVVYNMELAAKRLVTSCDRKVLKYMHI